jgi:tetratricopeptide (TPR) repeat protein
MRPGQGGSGERWPGIGGGGSRPGQGGSGERWPGLAGGGFRPGSGNRPFFGGGNASGSGIGSGNAIGSGNIGSGNIGQIGDNLGIVNRPNFGGNNFGGNNFQGGNTYNLSSNYASGYNSAPVIGGGGYGGGWGGGGWGGGWGGGGGGWAAPYYGNWYRGNFGNAGSFLGGFGVGALSSFGLGSLYGSGGWGGVPAFGVGYTSSVYNSFPSWNMSTYNDWGIGTVADDWINSAYSNPYSTADAAAQPAPNNAGYDYSQPINVASAPPDPTVADTTEQVFSAARDRFKAGDYQGALDLADQVLKQTPNAAVVHEFRSLVLFALKRYDDAATTAYAVLSAGPGWNWSTLIGLYPEVDTYTNQLRALEAYELANPKSSSAPFLLGYHYMIEGHDDAAAAQFEKVTQLFPTDQLSASFVKTLRKSPAQVAQAAPNAASPAQAPAAEPPAAAPRTPVQANAAEGAPAAAPTTPVQANAAEGAPAPDQAASPPPLAHPPASLDGSWKAEPAPEVAIALTIKDDGSFVWDVTSKGHKQSIAGQAGFQDGTLVLQHAEGPPLVGKVTQSKPDSFVFAPPGAGGKGGGLVFNR